MTIITSGTFVSTANTPYFLPLQQQIDYFTLANLSKLSSYTSGRITNALFVRNLSAGTAIVDATTTNTIASTVVRTLLAQGGFTLINSFNQPIGPSIAIASFVPGSSTVFTATAHGFVVGDVVRIGNMASAPQIGGLTLTVTAVTANTFTTLLNSTAALTSTGTVYKVRSALVPTRQGYYPQERVIASITQASPMVVTTLVQQNYQVGDVVRFQIPTVFGMQQITSTTNGLPVEFTVVAVNNAIGTQSVSLNVDSTAFTAFAWPAAANYPFSLPEMIPQGEGNTNNLSAFGVSPSPLPYANQDILGFANQNQGARGILIGAGDGTAAATTGGIIGPGSDTWVWEAHTSLQTFP